ncbi:hypothetical protein GUJ93_ZPchr0002g26563 [Zizania palustris]|uniref:Uncharacterized protein n=1 Tax=Zizania palustris TaxID=103762 RepID=A0A8J5RXL7_ZIZPA|nr:hypothetical protein GUJ93_ZPchr0002g26563 [Zizania palustris]
MRGRRLPHAAGVLLLWLAVLTFAFHWCGRRRIIHPQPAAFHLPTRKMLLTVPLPPTLDASSSSSSPSLSPPPTTTGRHQQHYSDGRHNRHHIHHHGHQHNHRSGGGNDRWNRHGVPSPAAGPGEEVDPRFGVQKRLVPTGPNPLHH